MSAPLDDIAPLRAAQREDLALFLGAHFHTLAPGKDYEPAWHAAAIAHHLEEVFHGRCRRLLITAPPRSLKSMMASVAFVAWMFGKDPTREIVCLSHTQELASDFGNACRTLMRSPGYRAVFPHAMISTRKDTETQFVLSAGGRRRSLSMLGPITGRGADVIIIDDPIKAQDVLSEAKRQEVLDGFRKTVVSRLNNQNTGAIVVVMQRLHEDDLAAHILEMEGWTHLDLPAIGQLDMIVPVGPGLTRQFGKGELLSPERLGSDVLAQLERDIGESGFSAQFLQRPQPADGAIFKRAWLRYLDPDEETRRRGTVFQSWDTATKTGDRHDFSVCTTWLRLGETHYLLDVFRAKLEYPDLRAMVFELQRRHRAQIIVIEDSVAGVQLRQELARTRPHLLVHAARATTEKAARAAAQSWKFKEGKVLIAPDQPWIPDLVAELLSFPRSRHDDQVDSAVQYLAHEYYRDTVSLTVGSEYLGGQ